MDRKGQVPATGPITDAVDSIIGDIPFLSGFCGDCSTTCATFGFDIKAPLGPLGVLAVLIGALVTNTVNFLLSPLVLAVIGIVLVGSLVYRLR